MNIKNVEIIYYIYESGYISRRVEILLKYPDVSSQ